MARSKYTLRIDVDTPKRVEALRRCLDELSEIAESAPWLADKCQRIHDDLHELITVEQQHN